MTKLTELKAAYEGVTPGEELKIDVWGDNVETQWVRGASVYYGIANLDGYIPFEQLLIDQDFDDLFDKRPDLLKFLVIAHNMMPDLLKALEHLEGILGWAKQNNVVLGCRDNHDQAIEALEKLK